MASEERIGKYISHRRDEFVLSTKVGYGVEGYPDWTSDCITAGIDMALTRAKYGSYRYCSPALLPHRNITTWRGYNCTTTSARGWIGQL